jgi:hypothetical protein
MKACGVLKNDSFGLGKMVESSILSLAYTAS